ncbi:MAG: hypothetical protein JXM73_26485 [Anaerolineae bacterium]|nr:hypothetical protein [Anaerolineae bacterium]
MLIPILVAIAIIILASLAIVLVAWVQQKGRSRTIQVELCNLGNVQSRYELQAKDPEETLKFQFTLDGDELPQSSDDWTAAVEKPSKSTPAASPSPTGGSGRGRGMGEQAVEGGGIVASILSTLGLLLPGSLGAPFTRAASQMQRGQVTASRVGQLKSQGTRLKSRKSGRPPKGDSQPMASGGQVAITAPDVAQPHGEAWAQTPSVEPGGVLMVDLQIRPIQSALRGSNQVYPFTILSRTAELRDPSQAPVVITEATVQFAGTSWFLRFLPYFVILAITFCLLALTFLLAGTG